MQFTNTFTIPAEIDEAFAVLTDLERVAPCMPGAKLETVDGDTYTGRVKVKVGPMSLTYRGTAEVVDKDPEAHTATISAKGNEARGGGTANADVTARLTAVDDGTEVVVETDIDVTGKPAQFGRGVMADVGAKIIDKFADCLSRRLAESDEDEEPGDGAGADEDAPPAAEEIGGDDGATDDGMETADGGAATASTAAVAAGASAATTTGPSSGDGSAADSGPRKVADSEPESEALDILEVAGDATLERALPLLVALTVIGLVIWIIRRRRD